MHVWLITIGEPLPCDGSNERLLRTGILAETLRSRGHQVTWWTSSFDHIRKSHRVPGDALSRQADSYRIVLMRSLGYRRNISPARFLDHWMLGRKFRRKAAEAPVPDLILCSMPTIELSREAVRYGNARGVPVILDIRDLWPDIFVTHAPSWLRPLVRGALAPLFRGVSEACAAADAIIAITRPILDWGLGYAGRSGKPTDRPFSFGYVERTPSEQAVADAGAFWRSFGIAGEQFTVCFFGTIGYQFDLGTVIDAAKRLSGGPRSFRFVLCGDGDRLQEYRERAAGLDCVVFPGWVGAAEIWTLMRTAQVGLAPYRNSKDFQSSLPNKSIEYLSAGLPVVSSLRGELEKLLAGNRCGVTYPEGNPEGLAACLEKLYDDRQELATLSQASKRLYLREFTAETVYGELADYLETMARHHACAPGVN